MPQKSMTTEPAAASEAPAAAANAVTAASQALTAACKALTAASKAFPAIPKINITKADSDFLLACILCSGGVHYVDADQVAKMLDYHGPGSVSDKFSTMRKKYNVHLKRAGSGVERHATLPPPEEASVPKSTQKIIRKRAIKPHSQFVQEGSNFNADSESSLGLSETEDHDEAELEESEVDEGEPDMANQWSGFVQGPLRIDNPFESKVKGADAHYPALFNKENKVGYQEGDSKGSQYEEGWYGQQRDLASPLGRFAQGGLEIANPYEGIIQGGLEMAIPYESKVVGVDMGLFNKEKNGEFEESQYGEDLYEEGGYGQVGEEDFYN